MGHLGPKAREIYRKGLDATFSWDLRFRALVQRLDQALGGIPAEDVGHPPASPIDQLGACVSFVEGQKTIDGMLADLRGEP